MTDTAGPFPSPYELDLISQKKRNEAANRLRDLIKSKMYNDVFDYDKTYDYGFDIRDYRQDAFDMVKKDLESCGWVATIVDSGTANYIKVRFYAKKDEPENN